MSGGDYINLDRYPIDKQNKESFASMVEKVRRDLAKDGCAVVRGFLTDAGLKAAVAEADSVADKAHRSYNSTNIYFTQDDETLPADHPARQFYERSNAFIPADNFAPNGALRQIYDFPGFDDFIRLCLDEQEDRFFRYADPLADVIVNTAGEGNGFPWHFDTNNFTVTLALQNAEQGGAFEYAPMIRKNGENIEEVSRVLDGTSENIHTLNLEPGDLQLFRGRYSLHRVAPLSGNRPRHVAIFSYVEQEGMCGSPERTRQLYGRVLPIHLERASLRADDYVD